MASKRVRNIVFFAFLALFFISAPLIVLYTAGFRYNIENGEIIRTGTLSIHTAPRGAGILIDDEDSEEKTPHVFNHMTPETYSITVSKDGYHNWNGSVDIESEQTETLANILLFKDSPSAQILKTELTSLTPSPDGNRSVYVQQESGWDEIWLMDLSDGSVQLIGRFISNPEADLTWSAGGGYFTRTSSSGTHIWTFEGVPVPLPESLRGDYVFWHPDTDHLLYFVLKESTTALDVKTSSTTTVENTDTDAIALDASVLEFGVSGNYTELRQITSSETKVVAVLPRDSYELAERDGQYVFLKSSRGDILLINIHASEPILLQASMQTFDWHEDLNSLVFSDGFEVSTYSPESHTETLITRQSDEILSVKWHPSGSAILIGSGTSITAVDTEKHGNQRNETTLVTADEFLSFWVSENGEMLFYYISEEEAHGLFSKELTSNGVLEVL